MPDEQAIDNEQHQIRWRTRRRMAIAAFVSATTIIIWLMINWPIPISEERIKAITPIVEMYYFLCGAIIGTYIGFTTWYAVSNGKK